MFKHLTRTFAPFALAWLLSAMPGTAAAQTAKRVTPTSAPAVPAVPRPACVVAELKGIGLHTHDPQERSVKAAQWLERNGAVCSLAQAITITSNRSAWLGTADTPLLMASIEGMIESLQSAAAAALAATTAAKPGTAPGGTPAVAATPTLAAPAAATTTTSGVPPAATNRPAATAPVTVPVVVPVAVPAAPAARPAT